MTQASNKESRVQGNHSEFAHPLYFTSQGEEITWLMPDAQRGCAKSQQRLGEIYLKLRRNSDDFSQAYKWLFISVALGNDEARASLSAVHHVSDKDALDDGFDLVEAWFSEKFEFIEGGSELTWTAELLRWMFSVAKLH